MQNLKSVCQFFKVTGFTVHAQGAEEFNSTEISDKFTVSMRRRLILFVKAPTGIILESSPEGRRFGKLSFPSDHKYNYAHSHNCMRLSHI